MSAEYHRTLKRQLRRHFPSGEIPPELEGFLQDVSDSYSHYEQDRHLLERAMDLSSEELIQKNAALREKNEMLDSFVYRVSHDLRTPANNLQSMLKMLNDFLPDEHRSPMINQILDHLDGASKNFLARLQDLLEMSRMEHRMDSAPEEIDLRALLTEIEQTFESAVEESGAEIRVELEGFDMIVFERENALSLFSNLIGNAIKYRSPERTPVVLVRTFYENGQPILIIRDNGMGIDMEQNKDKLFGMFNRFHNHVEGSGVGLYLVKKIVVGSGGSIDVKSEVGGGTEFKIVLQNDRVKSQSQLHTAN